MPQADVNRRLIELARAGKTVVRLKGGDPAVFGRLAEETEALAAAGVPLEIVPGITAALAAGSYAGIVLTHRDEASAVALVTGRETDDKQSAGLDFAALAAFPGTLVFYMGLTTAGRWTAELMAHGKPADTPAAIVRRCSWPDQTVLQTTLGRVEEELTAAKMRPPVIVIVGSVAAATACDWFASRPLFGTQVLVTRPIDQAETLCSRLDRTGRGMPRAAGDPNRPAARLGAGRFRVVAIGSIRLAGVFQCQRRSIFAGAIAWAGRRFAGRFAAACGRAAGRDGTRHQRGIGPIPSQSRRAARAIPGRSAGRDAQDRRSRAAISAGPRKPRPRSLARRTNCGRSRTSNKSSSTPAPTCRSPMLKSPPHCPPAESIGSRSPVRPSPDRWCGCSARNCARAAWPASARSPRQRSATWATNRPPKRREYTMDGVVQAIGEAGARDEGLGARENEEAVSCVSIAASRSFASELRHLSHLVISPSLFRRIADRAQEIGQRDWMSTRFCHCWKSTVTRSVGLLNFAASSSSRIRW